MNPEDQRTNCAFPNFFSDTLAPAVEERLPEPGSIASAVIDHTTKVPTFFDTVSRDLCDDGRMGAESRDAAVGFISRSATTAGLAVATTTLAGVALAAGAAPLTVLGAGVAAVAILPPAVEWTVNKIGGFFGQLLDGVTSGRS